MWNNPLKHPSSVQLRELSSHSACLWHHEAARRQQTQLMGTSGREHIWQRAYLAKSRAGRSSFEPVQSPGVSEQPRGVAKFSLEHRVLPGLYILKYSGDTLSSHSTSQLCVLGQQLNPWLDSLYDEKWGMIKGEGFWLIFSLYQVRTAASILWGRAVLFAVNFFSLKHLKKSVI